MIRLLFKFIYFKLLRWRINGVFPAHIKKYIVAVAPHTSNWDFTIGVMVRSITKMQNAKYLAKSSLFKPPWGWLFRAFGGYPVERSKNKDQVQMVVDIFNAHDRFIVAIAPEGTRQKVEKLKTGFYYIAKATGIPIVACGFDYEKKEVKISEPFYASEDVEKDISFLMTFFKGIKGKNPELGIS